MYGYDPETFYLHGSVASQNLNTARAPVCVTMTRTDGLMLARSVFEHTINYRSAMICGPLRLVTDPRRTARRAAALHRRARCALPVGISSPAQVPAHIGPRAGTRTDRNTSSKPGSRTDNGDRHDG